MLRSIIHSILPISSTSLQEIGALAHPTNIKAGNTFIRRKARNDKEYFLLNGICHSYLNNPEGSPVTLSFFTAGSVLSPHTTRTVNGLSVLNFQALTDISLLALDAAKFARLMVENAEIREFGNTVLRNELARKVDKEIGMVYLTARERLIKLRNDFHMLENYIPHQPIASYPGITNVSLSRLRRNLSR